MKLRCIGYNFISHFGPGREKRPDFKDAKREAESLSWRSSGGESKLDHHAPECLWQTVVSDFRSSNSRCLFFAVKAKPY